MVIALLSLAISRRRKKECLLFFSGSMRIIYLVMAHIGDLFGTHADAHCMMMLLARGTHVVDGCTTPYHRIDGLTLRAWDIYDPRSGQVRASKLKTPS
jgi:hypothetical protein